MFNWLKKLLGISSSESIPTAPKKNTFDGPIGDMIHEAAPFIKPAKPVKGRKKRNAQPPRR